MKSDERGMDTIFGALILVLVCMVASAVLMSIPNTEPQQWLETYDLEGRFDCILSSTIEVSSSEPGGPMVRSLSISTYLLETSTDLHSPQSPVLEESARAEISEVIDFYMSRCAGWLLQLTWENNSTKEIASRNQGAVEGSDTYVLERSVPDQDHGTRIIRLLMAV